MRALPITLAVLAAVLGACGSVHERGGCGSSADCPAGQYCARTADGSVCWPDAVPPAVTNVTVACLDPVAGTSTCLRDGVLRIQATVTDDAEVLGAEAALDVGGPPVPLLRTTGNVWAAEVQLRSVPFGHFEHAVVTTVTARDGARNTASLEPVAPTTVTRRTWKMTLGAALGHPSIGPTGFLAVPANNGRVHFSAWDGNYVGSVEPAPGVPQSLTVPTAVADSFWVGADDGHIYELSAIGGVWGAASRAITGGTIRGSLASNSNGAILAAVTDSGGSGVLYAVNQGTVRNGPPVVGRAFSVGPVADAQDGIFAVAVGSVHRYSLVSGIPSEMWGTPVSIEGTVSQPLACTSHLIATADTLSAGILRLVTANGDPQHLATTAFSSGGASVLADGSILVPEQSRTLSRWTSSGGAFPGWQKPDLGGAARTPLVTTSTTAPFLVPTGQGALHALRADGSIAWSGQLSAGIAPLQPGNIYTPAGQVAGQELSTAYFAGSDGVLHAVIVDGKLDGAAPWPKAFHDPRNTNRAGAQP